MINSLPMTPPATLSRTAARPLSRRAFLGGTVGAAALTLLAACSGSGSGSSATTGASAAPASGDAERPSRIVALNTGHLDHLLLLGVVPVGLAVAKSANGDPAGIPDYIRDRFGDTVDLLAAYERKAADWAAQRGTTPSVSVVRGRSAGYILTGPRSLCGSVVADAGFTRPTGQDFTDTANHDLSVENTDQLDADLLFYGFDGGAEQLVDSASWKALPVVTAGGAHAVDMDPWFLNASLVAAEYVLADLRRFAGDA